MSDAFDQAWGLAKAYPLLWPKELDNDPDFGDFFDTSGPSAFTVIPTQQGRSKGKKAASFVRLPNLWRGTSRRRRNESPDDKDLRLIHDYLESDVHEDIHVAMDNIGETSDVPLHNEIPAIIGQALQFQRRPRRLDPNDKTWENLDAGVSPTKTAVDTALGLAPHHHQAKRGKYKW